MPTPTTLENQNLSFSCFSAREDEEMSISALSRAKEEGIEKRKMEAKEKVQAQLGRIKEETRRLATIRETECINDEEHSSHLGNEYTKDGSRGMFSWTSSWLT